LVALALYSVVVMPELRGRRLARLAHERTMTFSKDGVTVRTTINESHSGWSPYRRLYRVDDLFLLRTTGRSTVMIVPARAFASPTDEAEFITLAERHIGAPAEN